MSTYQGFLIRDMYSDTGQIPTTGTASMSPDIIPYGSGNLSWSTANSKYGGPDIGQNVIGMQVNNLYVRAKNIGPSGQANVTLYYSLGSLLLTPNLWTPIPAPSATVPFVDGSGNLTVANGVVALVQAPFVVTNMATPPEGQHYCLVAVGNNNNVPFPLPQSFASNADFAQWVSNNPNVAWRNISFNSVTSNSFITTQLFGNENAASTSMQFAITGTGLSGVTVQALCNDSRLATTPYSASADFILQSGNTYTALLPIEVPGGIGTGTSNQMAMTFTLTTANGQSFPTSDITFSYGQLESENDGDLERLMQRPYNVRLRAEEEETIFYVILLGSNTYNVSGSAAS